MRVNALDHVNVITRDLEGSARFYAEVFGLERRNAPPPLTPANAQWMHDAAGRAIVHINSLDCPRTFERDVTPGPTGALHHVALNCSGYDEMIARLKGRALDHAVNLVAAIGLRQIFTQDPNGVLLELNFFGD
jgi:catechol 2,3-dioxygenase-like lactoylglutathione lyase family enzyme